ncbi:DUF3576 domain-containing protein [Candidatus Pelagibacter bacterium nBUS_33]|jgi:hypothetical protein|uniref:DUF3576 domain-containing protein n=1 Tax=Candidatus Pelagibacter bacterium nBUS_33 TaxID=3374193 RepID=UPI003EBEA1E6
MILIKNIKLISFLAIITLFLNGCNGKFPGADARKFPADPEKRIEQNIKEGRGFNLNEEFGKSRGGVFDFASSNGLWRASLDVIDFMPLTSVNYSGGIIITDWYSENNNQNESIKISIRFMTNEIRSDALNIKVFNRKCSDSLLKCKITETEGVLVTELKKEILKKATMYKKMSENKKGKKDYKYPKMKKKN